MIGVRFHVCITSVLRLYSSRKGRKILVVQTRRPQMDRCVCADCGSDHQQQRDDGERLDCGSGARHFRLLWLFWIAGFARSFWFFRLGDGFDGYRHLGAYAIMVGGAQLWARSPTRVCIYNIIRTIAHGGDGDVLAHGFEGFPLLNRLHCAIDLIVQRLQLVTIHHKTVVGDAVQLCFRQL